MSVVLEKFTLVSVVEERKEKSTLVSVASWRIHIRERGPKEIRLLERGSREIRPLKRGPMENSAFLNVASEKGVSVSVAF